MQKETLETATLSRSSGPSGASPSLYPSPSPGFTRRRGRIHLQHLFSAALRRTVAPVSPRPAAAVSLGAEGVCLPSPFIIHPRVARGPGDRQWKGGGLLNDCYLGDRLAQLGSLVCLHYCSLITDSRWSVSSTFRLTCAPPAAAPAMESFFPSFRPPTSRFSDGPA